MVPREVTWVRLAGRKELKMAVNGPLDDGAKLSLVWEK